MNLEKNKMSYYLEAVADLGFLYRVCRNKIFTYNSI
jgi:hypothetical protein